MEIAVILYLSYLNKSVVDTEKPKCFQLTVPRHEKYLQIMHAFVSIVNISIAHMFSP